MRLWRILLTQSRAPNFCTGAADGWLRFPAAPRVCSSAYSRVDIHILQVFPPCTRGVKFSTLWFATHIAFLQVHTQTILCFSTKSARGFPSFKTLRANIKHIRLNEWPTRELLCITEIFVAYFPLSIFPKGVWTPKVKQIFAAILMKILQIPIAKFFLVSVYHTAIQISFYSFASMRYNFTLCDI